MLAQGDLDRMIREGVAEKVTSEQRPEGNETASESYVGGRRDCPCKGSRVGSVRFFMRSLEQAEAG